MPDAIFPQNTTGADYNTTMTCSLHVKDYTFHLLLITFLLVNHTVDKITFKILLKAVFGVRFLDLASKKYITK